MSQNEPNRAPGGGGQVIALAAALLLGGWMLFATIAKILSPAAFVAAVKAYEILPDQYALAAATGIVALEMALAFMLITGLSRRLAAWINLPLLVLFAVMVARAIKTGQTDCGCYGEVLSLSPKLELGIDLGLIGLDLLVLWRGRNVLLGAPALRHALAWGSLCVGAVLFLAGNPVVGGEEEIDVPLDSLAILTSAEPSLSIPLDGLLFFFSTDCNHCWAFAGGVDLSARRLQGLQVAGITYGDPQSLEEFEYTFQPSFPIHVMKESMFRRIAETVPLAIWLQDGEVKGAWKGFVPSHRELAELGGYEILEGEAPPETAAEPAVVPAESEATDLFGGPLNSRHDND